MLTKRCTILWLIVLVCGGCTNTGDKSSQPRVFYPPSAIDVMSKQDTLQQYEVSHEVITFRTVDSPAVITQFYVNNAKVNGWDNVIIDKPNQEIAMTGHQCPFWILHVTITPATTFQQVQLDYTSEQCR